VFKDRGAFTNQEAKEALNFQITLTIGYVAIGILSTVILFATLFVINLSFLNTLLWIAGVVFSILGFVKAKDGVAYRYPFAIGFITYGRFFGGREHTLRAFGL
jgi:uncharacterized protein